MLSFHAEICAAIPVSIAMMIFILTSFTTYKHQPSINLFPLVEVPEPEQAYLVVTLTYVSLTFPDKD